MSNTSEPIHPQHGGFTGRQMMDSDYVRSTAQSAVLGSIQSQNGATRHRTFHGIDAALGQAVCLTGRAREILDRICPPPAELPRANTAPTPPPPQLSYAFSLQRLQDQLGELGAILEGIEGHI
jgi:hypothetical protein